MPADAEDGRTRPYSAVINLAARAGRACERRKPLGLLPGQLRRHAQPAGALPAPRRQEVRAGLDLQPLRRPQPVPYREDADTNRPLSPYAASKKAAEATAYTYHHLHGIDVTVFRYFTVYGPAGRPDMSVFRFVRRIAEGEPIVVFGDGTQQRDFTYVDDIARGTVAGLAPLGYEVINLGGDRPVRLSCDHRPDRRTGGPRAGDRVPPGPSGRRRRHLGRRRQGPEAARLVARGVDRRRASAARSSGTGRTARWCCPWNSAIAENSNRSSFRRLEKHFVWPRAAKQRNRPEDGFVGALSRRRPRATRPIYFSMPLLAV